MKFKKLGSLSVSDLCLGSMTWGTQNSEAEAHAQIDFALERGINFIDTAEMYPTTPVTAGLCGETERLIGTWIASRKARDKFVLATKIVGNEFQHIRESGPINAKSIRAALDASLKRLQTDYIDLYQLHWPNRGSYHFRKNWTFDPSTQALNQMDGEVFEILTTLDEQVKAGKIREIGLSNETVWGTMKFLEISKREGLPRVVSMQNEYSLMNRLYDTDFAELSHHEAVGLICYSPLAAGILTGKYSENKVPEGSRRSIIQELGGRWGDRTMHIADLYCALARKHGLHPVELALGFCRSRPFMTSTIFGATSLEQLDIACSCAEIELSLEILEDIARLHKDNPMPY